MLWSCSSFAFVDFGIQLSRDIARGAATIAKFPDSPCRRVQTMGAITIDVVNKHFIIQFFDDKTFRACFRKASKIHLVHSYYCLFGRNFCVLSHGEYHGESPHVKCNILRTTVAVSCSAADLPW